MKGIIDISLLKKNRDFRLLYLGQFISFLGSSITMVALPFQVYEITHSTFMVGFLSLIMLVPLLITALIGGVFADRYHRRRLLLICEILMGIGVLLLTVNASLETPHLWVTYFLALVMSGVNGFHRPAFDGITQQLLNVNDYKDAGILASFKFNFGMIVGPAIAGLLINYFGLQFTFAIDGLSFAFSILCLVMLKNLPKPLDEEHPHLLISLKEGLAFAINRKTLLGSYLIDFAAMVTAMPMALFPAIAISLGGTRTLGLLYAAPAVGALLISLFSGWTHSIKSDGKAIAISSGLFGLAIVGFGLSHNIWLALVCLSIAGAVDCVSGIFRQNLWNHIIPHNMRGRLSGIEMISYVSGPKLGDFRAGSCASFMGLAEASISGGLLCLLTVAYLSLKLPEFWNYRVK